MFLTHAKAVHKFQDDELVAGNTVDLCFRKLFGKGSSEGHTEIHPHKSDACGTCFQVDEDLNSSQMSVNRHDMQPDQTPQRRAAINQLEQHMVDLEALRTEHVLEATEAQVAYRDGVEDAHSKFKDYLVLWSELWMLLNGGHDVSSPGCMDLIHKLALARLGMSSDYQQDKMLPCWNSSPQPGPTYFFSKLTEYCHLIYAESLGDSLGPSKFGRNRAYIRKELIGGAKDSNDTISTIFDLLFSLAQPVCKQPPLYRTGYDEHGPVSNATDPAIVQTPTTQNAACRWAGIDFTWVGQKLYPRYHSTTQCLSLGMWMTPC